jgi:hypothetical protein
MGIHRVQVVLGGLVGFIGVLLAYRSLRPRFHKRRAYDGGAVSEAWLQQQRAQSSDPDR